jgi:hypothetical protein
MRVRITRRLTWRTLKGCFVTRLLTAKTIAYEVTTTLFYQATILVAAQTVEANYR